jgi:hypothetical protein
VLVARRISLRDTRNMDAAVDHMSNEDVAYDHDRYRKLLAEANDEAKRLALINLLIEEKAKARLADHLFRIRLSAMDRTSPLSPNYDNYSKLR